MGANSFLQIWPLKDGSIDATFRYAQERMRYNYGHAGYTGTIAEKDSYLFIARCADEKEALALANKMMDEDDARISDKWGPAGAVSYSRPSINFPDSPPTECVIFFGWASS
jgi:hypothetical protein